MTEKTPSITPHRTRIKICGIRDPQIARIAVEAGADAIGLVFVPHSPRAVDREQARAVIAALPAFVEPVGLFADLPTQELIAIAADLWLRTVQLHGREGAGIAKQLDHLRVIKAMPYHPTTATAQFESWRNTRVRLAGLLWDTPPAPDSHLTGGSGDRFDWTGLAQWQQRMTAAHGALPPTILAGGLTPENVGEAITLLRPYAVDVSSGVEAQRGVKDPEKIRAFCAAVRAADARCTEPE